MVKESTVKKARNGGFVFLGCVVLMMVVLLIWALVGRGSKDDDSGSSTGAAPSTVKKIDCNVADDGSKVNAMKTPKDIRWITNNDARMDFPVSDTVGPTKRRDSVEHCFAHSPMGAVLSTSYAMGVMNDPNKSDADLATLMTDPSKVKEERSSSSGTVPAYQTRFVGYTVENYDPEQATIGLVGEIAPDRSTESSYVKAVCTMKWQDGDWKVPPNSCPSSGASKVSSYEFTHFKEEN